MSLWLRYLAVILGVLALLDAAHQALGVGTVARALYLSTHPWAAQLCLLVLAAILVRLAFFPPPQARTRALLAAALGGLVLVAVAGLVGFFRLRAAGQIASPWPLPFSLLAALFPLLGLAVLVRPLAPTPSSLRAHLGALLGVALTAGVAVCWYIHAFGLTDYRRPAAAIVVLGARVYEDGTPSEALRERVETGVELFRAGMAPVLVMSGGVGREGHDEAAVMRQIALHMGVPDAQIVVDSEGNNTEATLVNARRWLEPRGGGRVLVVSHYHHLARVKLLGQRHGLACFTVPADEGATRLAGTPYYVLREAAALAFYYLRG